MLPVLSVSRLYRSAAYADTPVTGLRPVVVLVFAVGQIVWSGDVIIRRRRSRPRHCKTCGMSPLQPFQLLLESGIRLKLILLGPSA